MHLMADYILSVPFVNNSFEICIELIQLLALEIQTVMYKGRFPLCGILRNKAEFSPVDIQINGLCTSSTKDIFYNLRKILHETCMTAVILL